MVPSVHSQLADYFRTYGGIKALRRSYFIRLALALTALTFPSWRKCEWWGDVISVIPGLLGVSLAAFTLFLSAGSEEFRKVIAGKSRDNRTDPSPYLKTAAVFLHFLIAQLAALFIAIVAKSSYSMSAPRWFEATNEVLRPIFWALGYFTFLYALTVVLAASLGVYEVIRWYDDYITDINEDEENN